MTGYGQAADRANALQAGFDAHIVKPASADKIMRALYGKTRNHEHRRKHANERQRQRPQEGRTATATGTQAKSQAVDSCNHRELLAALRAFKRGDFDVRMRDDLTGVDGQIAETFNELVAMVKAIKEEAHDVCERRRQGRPGAKRMRRLGTTGGWAEYIAVGQRRSSKTSPATRTRSRASSPPSPRATSSRRWMSRTAATARGAASSFATRSIVNGMVARLSQFGSEVTRVALEVGGEGKLGAQARVQGVSGVWKDLTDSVNLMASNLTSQVREIARVTTAVAQGDLTQDRHDRRQGRDPRAQEHHQHDGRAAPRRSRTR